MSDLNYTQSYIESLSYSRTLLTQIVATIRQQDANLNNLISTQMRSHNQAHNQAHNESRPLIPNSPINTINENHIIDALYNENLYPQSFRDHVQRIRTAQQNRTDPQSIIQPIARNTSQNISQNTSQNTHHSLNPPYSPRQNINAYSNYVYPSNYAIPRRSVYSNNSRNYIFNWHNNNLRHDRHNLNLESFLSPVNIYPSPQQINEATQTTSFGEIINPVNSECPITREPFRTDEQVIRINQCGHVFNPPSLRQWFRVNVHCPMCRVDIRDNLDNLPSQNTRSPFWRTSQRSNNQSNQSNQINDSTEPNAEPNAEPTINTQTSEIMPCNSRRASSSNSRPLSNREIMRNRLNERRTQRQNNINTPIETYTPAPTENLDTPQESSGSLRNVDNISPQNISIEEELTNITNYIALGIRRQLNESDISDNLLVHYDFLLPTNRTDILINENITDQEILNQYYYTNVNNNNNNYNDNLSRNDITNLYNTINSTSVVNDINSSSVVNDNISSSAETED